LALPKISNGIVDLDLSGPNTTDNDIGYIDAFCANSGGRWKAIHTLDLSDTAITDRAIEEMALQDRFSPPTGLTILVLTNTSVSDAAIQKFQKKAPGCEIQK